MTTNALPAGWYADPGDSTRYRFWAGDQWTTHVRNRAEVDIAAAESEAADRPLPDFGATDVTDVGPDRTGRRRVPIVLGLLAVVALLATAGLTVLAPAGAGPHTLQGEVRVDTGAVRGWSRRAGPFLGDGTPCGTGATPGIGAGTEVTVSSGHGEILGRRHLEAGRLDHTLTSTTCVFHYEFDHLDDAGAYTVRVTGSARARASRDELEADGWRLDLRVG